MRRRRRKRSQQQLRDAEESRQLSVVEGLLKTLKTLLYLLPVSAEASPTQPVTAAYRNHSLLFVLQDLTGNQGKIREPQTTLIML